MPAFTMHRGISLFARSRLALLLIVANAMAAPAMAGRQDFLPPEEAFRYTVTATDFAVVVSWVVAPGTYMYGSRFAVRSLTKGVTLGETELPPGIRHEDPYFGPQQIYRGRFEMRIPYSAAGAPPARIELELRYQGCADAGLCYPPQTQVLAVEPKAAASTLPNRSRFDWK